MTKRSTQPSHSQSDQLLCSCSWLLLLTACSTAPPPIVAEPFAAAEAMFQRDPHWLGGDAVYSVDLGGDRILWLFGDSFVARGEARDRGQAIMVRNTIAIQRGRDPATARLQFHWRRSADGKPLAFFADDGELGFWPLHGIRLAEGPLLLWQVRVRSTPGKGLGFAIDGWRILRIDRPDLDPEQWQAQPVAVARLPFECTPGTAVWRDGDHVLALATRGTGQHQGLVCRFAVDELRGGGAIAEWWDGSGWSAAEAVPGPAVVLDEAGPECSVDRVEAGWLHVYSRGFGRTTVAVHTAKEPTGPWSEASDVFTPPESLAERPFVYAAKAHPELDVGDGWLAVSYAANSFDFGTLFDEQGQQRLYWPRFWRLRVE